MNLKIETGDLFNFKYIETMKPVHCISADARMGAGIAVKMNKWFKLEGLRSKVLKVGRCYYWNGVFNLITKLHYYDKPLYCNLTSSLVDLKELIHKFNVKKLVMPLIGCGLDKLRK